LGIIHVCRGEKVKRTRTEFFTKIFYILFFLELTTFAKTVLNAKTVLIAKTVLNAKTVLIANIT